MSKYGVFSGPYFPVFGPEKTPYLHTSHAVFRKINNNKLKVYSLKPSKGTVPL